MKINCYGPPLDFAMLCYFSFIYLFTHKKWTEWVSSSGQNNVETTKSGKCSQSQSTEYLGKASFFLSYIGLYFGTLLWWLLGVGMAARFGMTRVQVSVPPCGLCNIEAAEQQQLQLQQWQHHRPDLRASKPGISPWEQKTKTPTCFCDAHNKGLGGSYWQD